MNSMTKEARLIEWRASFAHRVTFKVLITGSREWPDDSEIRDALGALYLAAMQARRRMILSEGECSRGPDRMSKEWAIDHGALDETNPTIDLDPWPATWTNGDRGAGMRRNQQMVDAGPDVCLAFIFDNSSGASHCAGAAQKAGIPTVIWRIDDGVLTSPPENWMSLVPV